MTVIDAGFGPAPTGASAQNKAPVRRQGSGVNDHMRLMFFQALEKRKFFRQATCAEFANVILQNVGLPPVGQTDPVNGKRGVFDRAGQIGERPTFTDSLELASHPPLSTQISARPVDADRWQLEITRTHPAVVKPPPAPGAKPTPTPRPMNEAAVNAVGKALQTKTQFTFRVMPGSMTAAHVAKSECQLIGLRYGTAFDLAPDALKLRDISIEECATDYLINPVLPSDHAAQEMKDGITWLRFDCITALHYSAEARTRALQATP